MEGKIMIVNVIGTGEAFNESLTNSSIYIEDSKKILIDCGFTVPFTFFKKFNPNDIDLIYITHFHGDHFFGLPALITRMIEENRTKELTIIGQKDIESVFNSTLNLAYSNILTKANFKINFIKFYDLLELDNIHFYFARTNHSVLNYAILIKTKTCSISISGDGAPTNDLINMYNTHKPNLIIQECFTKQKSSPVHCSLEEINNFVSKLDFESDIRLIHISRKEIKNFKNIKYKILKDGEAITL